MKPNRLALAASLTAALGGLAACGGDDPGPLDGVDSIVFLQRPERNEMGDIFQYTSYIPGARLVTLSPPTADGELTVICCNDIPGFENVDISGYDLSFDAREIVFSAKLSNTSNYGLFVLSLDEATDDNGRVEQIPTDPTRDYVQPVFLPGSRIMFMTNRNVEGDPAMQHRDEYERGTTLQLGVINRDGSEERLGARNLSHRVHPSILSDGRVMLTQWDHLGDMNAGHLVASNPDMTTIREVFGKEGTGVANSYLKAREIQPGRVVAIATSRDRTLQAGALIDVRLGGPDGEGNFTDDMSEEAAQVRILTPEVPRGREPSSTSVGRYYDAYPLNTREQVDLLVSWSDGPVESGTLEAAGTTADFGVYLYSSSRDARQPIYNDPDMWDIFARPLAPRSAPPQIADSGKHQFNPEAALIGSLNVYDSSLEEGQFADGSIYGVRVIEGFSVEEGVPDDFGITEHEGAAVLGVAPVYGDGSWAALIPANVPVHVQPIDVYGMSAFSEPVWFSGAPGESRFCGGCHESRTSTTVIQPGITQAVAAGPVDLHATTPRLGRVSNAWTRDAIVGVPWDTQLQAVLDANCVSCHDGSAGAANPQWTISDPETGESFTWTFNLSGDQIEYGIGDEMFGGYSASHLSLMGPDMMELEEAGLVITGDIKIYVEPGNARESILAQKLNPPRQFPEQDLTDRAFDTAEFPPHVNTLTADEYYLLLLMMDNGGQFYSRENAPGY